MPNLLKNDSCTPPYCVAVVSNRFYISMGTRYTKTKTKKFRTAPFGSTKGQKIFLCILGILALVIIIFATSAVVSFIRDSKATEVTTADDYGTLEDLVKPEYFIEKYMQVNCNDTVLRTTQSIRITGQILSSAVTQEYRLTKRQPHFMRLQVTQGTVEFTVGADGEKVWRRLRIANQDDKVSIFTGEGAAPWLEKSRFYDRIISTHLGGGLIKSIETTDYESKTYLKVTILSPEKKLVEALVDPTTMYPFAEINRKDDRVETTIFTDFHTIDEMPIPFHLETFIDGVSERVTIINDAKINIGVLSDYFIAPKEVSAD